MDVIDFISAERLKTYEVHTGTRKKAIALHNHTLQLGSSLLSMIALLELALRNSTNLHLSADFDDFDWLLPGHTSVPLRKREIATVDKARKQAQREAYSKLSYQDKISLDTQAFPTGIPSGYKHNKVVKARQRLFNPSHGQIISQTTFS